VQLAALGEHVAGVARLDPADRQHGRLERIDLAGNDLLQRDDEVRQREDHVLRLVRQRAVPSLAGHVDVELVGGGHHVAVRDDRLAARQEAPEVQPEHEIDAVRVEHPLLDDPRRTRPVLLGRLEEQHDPARQRPQARRARPGDRLGHASRIDMWPSCPQACM